MILIIAIGHSYYGKMAYNLAVSIKANSPIPVALVYDAAGISHLKESQKAIFDKMVICPDEYKYTQGRFDSHKPKIYLDKLTPFKKTLFLDADTIWNSFKKPEDLFKELDGKDFKIANRGYDSNLSMWVDVEEIKKQFAIDKFLDCSSEVIYFEKTDVFDGARKAHKTGFNHRKIGIACPDEPCISIALGQLERKEEKWKPSYWYYANPRLPLNRPEIKNNYYVISAGGAFHNNHVKNLYEDYTKIAFNKVKLKPFELIQKSKVIPERKSY